MSEVIELEDVLFELMDVAELSLDVLRLESEDVERLVMLEAVDTLVAVESDDVLRLESLDVLRLVIVDRVDAEESELVDRVVSLVAVESDEVLRLDSLESDEGVFDDSLVAVERLELDVEDEDIIISRCLNC